MSDRAALPSGIVTFVLTDIEGSTRLLRRLGERYPEVLERHLDLMAAAWSQHGGREVDRVGDSAMVVFADASSALEACVDAQNALAAEPWPAGGEVRVRMGVHSGLAAPRDGRYVALAVHQAARVMSAAHGGQVLVSADAITQLSARDLAIVPLGHYRLRDFDEPVQLFELAARSSNRRFPGVRALPADGHNLVSLPTSFVGREAEVNEIVATAAPGKLLTLTGTGGVGKTRLAIEAGHRAVPSWPDGVWFVDLTTLEDPGQLAAAIGDAVGAPNRGSDRWADVLDHLRTQTTLLILDNCEHLGGPVGDAVTMLLTSCRSTGVLATSREPLGIVGEFVRRVEPLAVPDLADAPSADHVSPSVALFVDRARAARAGFENDGPTAPVVAEICRRLDGLPLALELAAARLSELSPEDVLRGLRDRFRLLRSRQTGVPDRQRTMEHVLEWSDRLLDPPAQQCLRRLGVFGSSFSLDGATAAVADDALDGDDVPDLVWSLVDKSLVVADLTANHTRYRLLESVRDFALRRLEAHDEVGPTAARLSDWYLAWIGPALRHRQGWFSDVAVELDNLRALVPLVAPVDEQQAQVLAATIGRYLGVWGSSQASVDELRHHLAALPAATPARIGLLTVLADGLLALGEVAAAERTLDDARALFAQVGELPSWDDACLARAHAELCTRSGNAPGAIEVARGALAQDLSAEGRGRMWCQLGIAAATTGDLSTAARAFEEELSVWATLGDEYREATASGNVAEIALRRGDVAVAATRQLRCLEVALELGSEVNVAFTLILAARIRAPKDPETATVMHALAEAILDRCGLTLYEADRRASDEMLDAARRDLGDAAFGRARSAGVALDLPAGAALAERVLRDAANRQPDPED